MSNRNETSEGLDKQGVSMISLQQTNIKKKSVIDFSKVEFNEQEKYVIKKEIEVIKEKYPNYIPILVRAKDKKIKLSKNKYLVGGEITIGQFMFIIRKKIPSLRPEEGIYLFIDNIIPLNSSSLKSVYESKRDSETDMLFVTICKENTFGS